MRRRAPHSKRRGFSMLEVLIGAAVLGIGVLSAVRIFMVTAEGSHWTRSRSDAMEMGMQRLELMSTQDTTQIPNCQGPVGCREDQTTMRPDLPPVGGFECTQYFGNTTIADPTQASDTGKYRVDTVVAPHPDAVRQPGAQMVVVSVCWMDGKGNVHEAQSRRIMTPDV